MQEKRFVTLRLGGPRPRRRERLTRLLADERGVAALELALTLPLLAALLLGAADLAVTAARAREVEALVEAATKAVVRVAGDLLPPLIAGSLPPGAATRGQPGLSQVPKLAPLPSPSLASLVEVPRDVAASLRLFRGCSGDEGIREVTATRCPDGSAPAAFAEIVMTAPVARLVDWPAALLSPTVSARSLVRLD